MKPTSLVRTFCLVAFIALQARAENFALKDGDRVTGGGGWPIDLRLRRDVFAYKPTVMTIMLGMNDGSYRAFDETIFGTYATGYQHVIDSVKEALSGIRIT